MLRRNYQRPLFTSIVVPIDSLRAYFIVFEMSRAELILCSGKGATVLAGQKVFLFDLKARAKMSVVQFR